MWVQVTKQAWAWRLQRGPLSVHLPPCSVELQPQIVGRGLQRLGWVILVPELSLGRGSLRLAGGYANPTTALPHVINLRWGAAMPVRWAVTLSRPLLPGSK